jgi:hypothetical protein
MPKDRIFPFALMGFLWLCAPLFARDVEIMVRDADLEIPLEGALIHSWDGAEYSCDENGLATVPVPDDRQVVIRVAYPGYENGRLLIPVTGSRFSCVMRLGGVMENRELVLEARRPDVSETKSGRSIAISGETLSRTSEIGFIEDVMTSIKLLPGVGYTSMFNALPSIRGGDPGDLMAAMDGFYIEQPYHWGGAYSIFVPQMVESARLSHGIFSSRYGHTISGLLEIVTRKPSPTETQVDLGVSTSETNLNLSFPLWGKGGIAAMGKVTYWDPFVWGAQQIAKGVPELDMINSITTAPYIRDSTLTANYRFSTDLELTATGFFGGDGVGAEYHNTDVEFRDGDTGDVNMRFDWLNYTVFTIAGLTYNPRRDMLFKVSAGWGLYESDLIADIGFDISRDPLFDPIPLDPPESLDSEESGNGMAFPTSLSVKATLIDTTVNGQFRTDFDWTPAEGLLFAAGVQELYSQWTKTQTSHAHIGYDESESAPDSTFGSLTSRPSLDVKNQGLSTSAYTLLEYQNPARQFGAELGLRMDHFYFIGRDFTIQTWPVLNPRLNLDFGILKNKGIIETLTLTAGTGLFSSMNDAVTSIDFSDRIGDFDLKPNRSWTSLLGAKIDFAGKFSFNIEAYYKHVFDRAYMETTVYKGEGSDGDIAKDCYWFNGMGRIAGFDFILQKLESRYWDGWLSYSFTWAQYRDPNVVPDPIPGGARIDAYPETGNNWYYPSFHRYHNINLVLNLKPSRSFNVGMRFGFASGTPEDDHNNERTGFSWPVDVKFSFFKFNPRGKVSIETYLAVENLQSLVYDAIWIARVNGYTGEEELNEYTPVYDMPIPMISFGFKWRY